MSRMSREDMLRELELLPVWQLRQPLPSLLKVEAPAVDKSEQLVTEQIIEASVVQEQEESALEQSLPLPLRLLLSEDSLYAFLMAPYATDSDVQEIETLLQNMIRAMQVSCRVDVTDTADKIFAVHTPRLIICLGAEPANRLSGKIHTIVEWRNIQQQNQPRYEQIPLLVTYHPAHLLVNTADKALAWRDLCAAMKLVQNL